MFLMPKGVNNMGNYSINVHIYGKIDSHGLYIDLSTWHMCVTDLGEETYVYGPKNLTKADTEEIIGTCYNYGKKLSYVIKCNN